MPTFSPESWRQISPYLDQVLALPEAERATWVESFRVGKPELADLLEELLEGQRALIRQGFLEGQAIEIGNEPSLAGETVGAYRLLSRIGEGGMGSVWLAERNDGRFERQVAVKFLRFPIASRGAAERFKREGRILGQLSDPHIAELIDAGLTPNGEPYLVLEHVDGEQVDEYCDRRTLDVEARVRLFLDVLSAVGLAHANLVVHRDLKPSNVLVRNDGQVKLLDFGIAKLLTEDGNSVPATQLTREGGALTPQFAAPEQVSGGAVTTATDVYALGVLLYLLLTGQHPAGPGPFSPADLVRAIVETETARASDAVMVGEPRAAAEKRGTTPERLRRELRNDLDTIIGKALKKNPAERYLSVTVLADDLRRFLKHEPISARPDSFTYRTAKFVRRNRVTVALTAVALVAVISGTIGTLIQARTARHQRDFALRQLNRADAINEFNTFILSDAIPGKPFTTKELLDHATHILERQRAANGDRVELMGNVGLQYSFLGGQKEATRVLEEAYRLSRGVPERGVRATVACQFASALVLSGELERAESLFQEGMRELPDDIQFVLDRVECLRRGSEVAQERGDVQEGLARMEAAQQALKNSAFNSDWSQADVLLDLGEAYRVAGQNYKASSVFESVNRLLSSLGRDDARIAGVLDNDWALALEKLGRPLEAEKLFRRSLEIQGAGVEPIVLNNYAITLRTLGRFREALSYSESCYRKGQETADNFAVYRSLYEQALIHLDEGNFERASGLLAQLEPILRRQFSPDNPYFGLLASLRALLESGRGNSQQALLLADQAVAILEASVQSKGQGTHLLASQLLCRASVELSAGHPNKAEVDADHALELFKAAVPLGTLSSYIGTAYLKLGAALQAEGRADDARAAFSSAAVHLEATLPPDHPATLAAQRALARLSYK